MKNIVTFSQLFSVFTLTTCLFLMSFSLQGQGIKLRINSESVKIKDGHENIRTVKLVPVGSTKAILLGARPKKIGYQTVWDFSNPAKAKLIKDALAAGKTLRVISSHLTNITPTSPGGTAVIKPSDLKGSTITVNLRGSSHAKSVQLKINSTSIKIKDGHENIGTVKLVPVGSTKAILLGARPRKIGSQTVWNFSNPAKAKTIQDALAAGKTLRVISSHLTNITPTSPGGKAVIKPSDLKGSTITVNLRK